MPNPKLLGLKKRKTETVKKLEKKKLPHGLKKEVKENKKNLTKKIKIFQTMLKVDNKKSKEKYVSFENLP